MQNCTMLTNGLSKCLTNKLFHQVSGLYDSLFISYGAFR